MRGDEEKCADLCREYARRIDAADFHGFADLFADDAVLDLPGRPMRGRDAMIALLSQRKPSVITMHFCTNILIEMVDAARARGSTYVAFYRHDLLDAEPPAPIVPPAMLGVYEDDFVRTAKGWRFARRALRPLFRFP